MLQYSPHLTNHEMELKILWKNDYIYKVFLSFAGFYYKEPLSLCDYLVMVQLPKMVLLLLHDNCFLFYCTSKGNIFTHPYPGKSSKWGKWSSCIQVNTWNQTLSGVSADVDMWLMNYIIWVLKLVNAPRSGEAFTSVCGVMDYLDCEAPKGLKDERFKLFF